MIRIIGIMLVKNEDVYVHHALKNILSFCDEIYVLDHQSTDQTREQVAPLVEANDHVHFHSISDPKESHAYIESYAGKPVWVFGVDGDEVYDPNGLVKLREQLLSGEYRQHWVLFGNVVNCNRISADRQTATGYATPPCRSMTKLYNFSAINKWTGAYQRLHGGEIKFADGFSDQNRLKLYDEKSWEESFFRCLHMCFVPRSSTDPSDSSVSRPNISEILNKRRVLLREFKRGWPLRKKNWKEEKYKRGELVTVSAAPFFSGGK